ncbi:NAD(P)H-dependent FMN reductase [Jatrophihabitans sp. GAS493]|uniref:NADPH-dependent FMN reductase n=1 Tax=Jatrophihabitans sp. GAS493 TaxID=1907575 RepID=UPI000BB7191C|nr:NAD(P)H-dependent oxidoreductase [Jatrophihabitans sp. GAS493]SOD71415.1 NAD(P)H-dependent FMN reductase [Jatrophihabitans sp. GAS493]
MKVAVVAGNPKPNSRTLAAATLVAERLTGRPADVVVDVVTLGPGLIGWGDPAVAQAVAAVQQSDYLICASPTYKATYTGLLKLFLDQFPSNGLDGVTAFAIMLGAGPQHALAPELLLKPVLVELGASLPSRALYLLDSEWETSAALQPWVDGAQRFLTEGAGARVS